MTEDEHIARCWERGYSLGETVRSLEYAFGKTLHPSYIRTVFARLAHEAYGA